MAANSGGLEWSAVLKPFLSASKEKANQCEIIELCSTIVKRYVSIIIYAINSLCLEVEAV